MTNLANRPSARESKKGLVDAIEAHLREDAARSALDVEVSRLSNLEIAVRVKVAPNRPAYHHTVRVSGE